MGKDDVLKQLDGDYLLDYAIFTGAIRTYVTHTLENAFASEKAVEDVRQLHRRFFLLSIYAQEYLAYEDLGAMLDALISHLKDPEKPILARLMSYKPGEVALSKLMSGFGISSPETLATALGFDQLVPPGWMSEYPSLNLTKALHVAAQFFFVDCVKNQKVDGVKAFNKLKHGLLAVPHGQFYLKSVPNAPATLFATNAEHPEAADNPISLFSLPMTDDAIEGRLRSIHFVQCNLRMIAALLVVTKFPQAALKRKQIDPLKLFKEPYLKDVHDFIQNVTNAKP